MFRAGLLLIIRSINSVQTAIGIVMCCVDWPLSGSRFKIKIVINKTGNNYESNQQDATVQVNLLFLVSSTCFGRCFRSSSGERDSIYSIW